MDITREELREFLKEMRRCAKRRRRQQQKRQSANYAAYDGIPMARRLVGRVKVKSRYRSKWVQ